MRFFTLLFQNHIKILLGIILFFVVLRLPSLIEPLWYGDEGIYLVIGKALAHGKLLYVDVWDNKPPLLYLFYTLLQSDLFLVKLASLLIGVATVITFYLLARVVLKKQWVVVIVTILFAFFFGSPLLEGNIANAENIMLLPIALAFYFMLGRNVSPSRYLAAGICLSLAIMTKVVALFDTVALIGIVMLLKEQKNDSLQTFVRRIFGEKKMRLFFAGLGIIPLVFLLYFFANGALLPFLQGTFSTNVGYVGYKNHFMFPLGLLVLKVFLLFASLFLVYRFRKSLAQNEVVVFVWMLFALFSVFFSDRPYTHYMLMGIMPFCLLVGLILEGQKKVFSALFILLITIVTVWHFPLYKKIGGYYSNYFSYVYGNKSFREYVAFFDRSSVRDYDLATALRAVMKTGDNIYFWSDSAQLYMLTGVLPFTKYIVGYHIEMNNKAAETTEELQRVAPRYIVSTKSLLPPATFTKGYVLKYVFKATKIYEKES